MIIKNIDEIKKIHTIIIGAGPAGISLALKLEKKKNTRTAYRGW